MSGNIESRIKTVEETRQTLTQLAISASERMDTHESWINELGAEQVRLARAQADLSEAQARTEASLVETNERLNILINVCILRILFAFFALSMLFFHNASAQGKQEFTHVKNVASIRCQENQLSVRHVSEDAAMGGVRTISYAFTNTSSSPCTLSGYPRFEVLNKSGRLVRRGRAANGLTMMGDDARTPPRLVTIEPGKTASFLVYYNAGGAGHVRKPCPIYRKVRITAPGAKRGFVLREELQLCGRLEVSPAGLPTPE